MQLTGIIAADEEAAALADAALGDEFVLGDRDLDDGVYGVTALDRDRAPAHGFAPLDWHDDPDTLIAEVLALHRVPATLSERMLEAIHRAPARPVGDPLADLAIGLDACLSFAPLAS